ncbi:S26 family signal peptidase [Nonomuraea soli]|uniref:Signal peptidase I n=1 Tax=Nonomuraea soli TaxID=1032476 RepID=A0A7W0CGX7_9ACTN|nr:S26 family signal peptidase [Nonomuraea soli]MBA2890961.1 signal peptidase I [Nonomuraea soli]
MTISGESMAPTYLPGDRVLVHRRRPGRVGRGQVVVVRHPDLERLAVFGDGVRSADSRHWGYVSADRLLGVVARRMST